MGLYYHIVNKKLNSSTVKAAKVDSFQDVLISSATLISFGVSKLTSLPLDGVIGLAISVIILINGMKLVKSTMDKILGSNIHKTLSSKIMSEIMKEQQVLGAHDLMIHDYGQNNCIGSVHVELPSNLSLNDAHRIVDAIEKSVFTKNGVELVVHTDPVNIYDNKSKKYRKLIRKKLEQINPALTFHDFRLDEKLKTISIDIVIPFDLEIDENTLITELKKLDFNEYCFEYIIDYQ